MRAVQRLPAGHDADVAHAHAGLQVEGQVGGGTRVVHAAVFVVRPAVADWGLIIIHLFQAVHVK